MEHWKIVFTENKALPNCLQISGQLSPLKWALPNCLQSTGQLSSRHWQIVFKALDNCLHEIICTGKMSSLKIRHWLIVFTSLYYCLHKWERLGGSVHFLSDKKMEKQQLNSAVALSDSKEKCQTKNKVSF